MAHDVESQGTKTSVSTGGRKPRALRIALALALVGSGIAAGIGGTVAARHLTQQSISEIAVGTWTCNRSGGTDSDRPIRAKVFVGSDSWALVELGDNQTSPGGREFPVGMREGGTWRLTNGRLEVHSSGANFTIEELPKDLSSNRALVAKEAFPFTRSGDGERRDSSVSYNDGTLTLHWEEYTFHCSKDRAE
ncbi:hypothetical protein ABZ570_20710 [Micromonospora sp. NPDC007271]|uniref:hypothetical protein n=1 Tax=Micromonospora sp. NPDC007271 TaxID=3154587 RepID=UPI0033C816E9